MGQKSSFLGHIYDDRKLTIFGPKSGLFGNQNNTTLETFVFK
jgi:hypothetical protein